MSKKLLFGIVSIFFFAAIFLATLPLSVEELHDEQGSVQESFEETEEQKKSLDIEEKLDERRRKHSKGQRIKDDFQTFREAVSSEDRNKCEEIDNITLRHDCGEATPPSNIANESTETEEDIPSYSEEDTRIYRQALSSGDSSLCEDIQNSNLRKQCVNEVNA